MEDTEIVALLWQRRESALDEITRRYGRMLKNFAARILPTSQDAEECINDALLDIWNTVPTQRPASVASYAVRIGDTQECGGVIGTLNSAVIEDRHLLLNYTFNWSGLEEAADGSFHTYFLPWFFYVTEGDNIICRSEYTKDLHTQTYGSDAESNPAEAIHIYCIDLKDRDGRSLMGKELTVRLLYAPDGKGFVSTFTPEACFTDRSWDIDKTYEFNEHKIVLNKVRESALYVTLFIDCASIGHIGDDFAFVLSDELGNDYTAYSNGDSDADGYWFVKPETLGTRLTLKIIRSGLKSDPQGNITDDSYEVLYEIPIELKTSASHGS